MEGASKHPKKSTDELPHPTRAQPYLGVVHAGRQFKRQSHRLLSICQLDISGTVSTGQNKNTSTSSNKIDQLLDRGAAHRPRKRGILWAQPLYLHICVRGDTGWTNQSTADNHQTFDSKKNRTLEHKAKPTSTAADKSFGCRKCRLDSRTDGRDRTQQP